MNTPAESTESTVRAAQVGLEPVSGRRLPSGRSVVLKLADNQEELEVRSPAGEVEVRIFLTDRGAVVRLSGARLELDSADTVALTCRRLQVQTQEGTELLSDGDVRVTGREMRLKTESDIHVNGGVIHLNC